MNKYARACKVYTCQESNLCDYEMTDDYIRMELCYSNGLDNYNKYFEYIMIVAYFTADGGTLTWLQIEYNYKPSVAYARDNTTGLYHRV